MLSNLESSFEKLWVLPFSARGGSDEELKQIDGKMPQKLSQYCFLGPIAMAFDALKNQEEKTEENPLTPNSNGNDDSEENQPQNPHTNPQLNQSVNYSTYPKADVDESMKKRLAVALRQEFLKAIKEGNICLLYTSPSPRDA